MSNVTLGDLTLCKNEDSQFRWVRLGGKSPQGWDPVQSGTVGFDFYPMTAFESYIVEVNFDEQPK